MSLDRFDSSEDKRKPECEDESGHDEYDETSEIDREEWLNEKQNPTQSDRGFTQNI